MLKVTIDGEGGSGKSVLLHKLNKFMHGEGYRVSIRCEGSTTVATDYYPELLESNGRQVELEVRQRGRKK